MTHHELIDLLKSKGYTATVHEMYPGSQWWNPPRLDRAGLAKGVWLKYTSDLAAPYRITALYADSDTGVTVVTPDEAWAAMVIRQMELA